ncbi:MAG: hypothetical protein MUE41_17970 [Gemmatimonadaceae bacterium]|nr:hypothetical protein [Gemmatimonadaceae bacterium]
MGWGPARERPLTTSSASVDDEGALVSRALAGDGRALGQLLAPHLSRALVLARRIAPTRDDAEDLVQDACVRAMEQLERFTIGRPFGLRRVRTPCAVSRTEVERRNALYRQVVRQVAIRNPALSVLDATPLFCDAMACHAGRSGDLLYQDGNHLTLSGSRLVAQRLRAMLQQQMGTLADASS